MADWDVVAIWKLRLVSGPDFAEGDVLKICDSAAMGELTNCNVRFAHALQSDGEQGRCVWVGGCVYICNVGIMTVCFEDEIVIWGRL